MEIAAELRPVTSKAQCVRSPVLVVDLDGTLVKTDLLLESLVALLKQSPHYVFCLPFWLLKGKAYLKEQIARRVSLDIDALPYREDVLEYLKAQHAQQRVIVLATGADIQSARQVADDLKLFDLVLASDGITNLSGVAKKNRLVSEFGEKGFDYVGNDRLDLVVWASARKAILVNPSPSVSSCVARSHSILTGLNSGMLSARSIREWNGLITFRRKMKNAMLPGPDGIGTTSPLVTTGLVSPQDARNTMVTFTGGFKRTHGAFAYGGLALRNRGSHYGFIENDAE